MGEVEVDLQLFWVVNNARACATVVVLWYNVYPPAGEVD